MKAKVYAKKFLSDLDITNVDDVETRIGEIVIEFSSEAVEIAKKRMPEPSMSCLIAVLREQSNKWGAFARIVNKQVGQELVSERGFKRFTEVTLPEVKGKL